MPKYLTVKSLVQARLKREMVKGQRLPSEAVLCEDFGVSRITMQKALGIEPLEKNESFSRMTVAALLSDELGVEIGGVEQTISATLADPCFAEHLGVEVGAPVLEGNRTYFDNDKVAVFCTTAFYRSDRHCFVVRLRNWRNEQHNLIKGGMYAAGQNMWK